MSGAVAGIARPKDRWWRRRRREREREREEEEEEDTLSQ